PTTMVSRRSTRSASTPAMGLSSTEGSTLRTTTPLTAKYWITASSPSVRIAARDIRANRLSQSPRLDRDSEIHSRRNGVIARTVRASPGAPRGAGLLMATSVAMGTNHATLTDRPLSVFSDIFFRLLPRTRPLPDFGRPCPVGNAVPVRKQRRAMFHRGGRDGPPRPGSARGRLSGSAAPRGRRSGLLGGALRRRLLGRGLLRGRTGRRLLRRGLGPAVGQEFGGALHRDRLHVVALAQGGVALPVGDVGAEAALLDHHGPAGLGVRAEFPQRRRRGAAAPLLRLREQLPGLLDGDREQLLLGLQGAAVAALLQVRSEPSVLCRDLLAVDLPDHPRQRQQPQRVLQGDRVHRHGLQQGRGARLGRGGPAAPLRLALGLGGVGLLDDLGDVGTETAVLGHDGPPRLRVLAEFAVPAGLGEQLLGPFPGQLVGGEV